MNLKFEEVIIKCWPYIKKNLKEILIGIITTVLASLFGHKYHIFNQRREKHFKDIKKNIITPLKDNLLEILQAVSLQDIMSQDFGILFSTEDSQRYIRGLKEKSKLYQNLNNTLLEDVKSFHYPTLFENLSNFISYLEEKLPLFGEYHCNLIKSIHKKFTSLKSIIDIKKDIDNKKIPENSLQDEIKSKITEGIEDLFSVKEENFLKVVYFLLHDFSLDKISVEEKMKFEASEEKLNKIVEKIKEENKEILGRLKELRSKIEDKTRKFENELEKILLSQKLPGKCKYI